MFSGGSYEEVARWTRNFLTSHAKREHARAEVELDAVDEASYSARVRLGTRVSGAIDLRYPEVARNRENLKWCADLAVRVREVVRGLVNAAA